MKSNLQNWNPEDYAKNSAAQMHWAQELIAKLALNGAESVLDIGCGDGKITSQIAQIMKSGQVLGIDLSASMIRFASERYPRTEYPNLRFQQMDAAEIRLPDRFDVVFSNAALHWVEDHRSVLRGVRACLKSGGRILFQMGGRGNADGVFAAIRQVIQSYQWKQHFENFTSPYHFYAPEEYREWLVECGFQPVRVELIPKDMRHDNEALMGWLRTTWFPYTDRLPIELRDPFFAEVIETYIGTHPIDSIGNIHVGMVRLEVEANAV